MTMSPEDIFPGLVAFTVLVLSDLSSHPGGPLEVVLGIYSRHVD